MAQPRDYIELRVRSAFSFLEACSNPEDLIEAAAERGYPALALADRDGVCGAPRFHRAARAAGLRALVGAEIAVEPTPGMDPDTPLRPAPRASGRGADRLLLLVESAEGWRRLCRLLTLAHGRRDKALEARDPRARARIQVRWDELEALAGHWSVLVRGDERLTAALLDRAKPVFGDRLAVDVSHLLDRRLARAGRRAADLAASRRIAVVASGDVRCARPRDRRLLDALVCLRERVPLDAAGRHLAVNAEGHLHDRAEIVRRFADHPDWILATRRIAERCEFTLENLDYRFPVYPLRPGETQIGACASSSARAQIEKELERHRQARPRRLLPDRVGHHAVLQGERHPLPGPRVGREQRRLLQPRHHRRRSGGMELLFERFLSEERGEWPDIDIDLPSGDRARRSSSTSTRSTGRMARP
jgi:error-prone DNA polymerase